MKSISRTILSLLSSLMILSFAATAAEPIVIQLWPDGAPTDNGLDPANEHYKGASLYAIANAELWLFPAKKPNGTAIVCAPGGGYAMAATAHEGKDWADWMNAQGITFAVLKYRMPNGHDKVPLEDGRRAMQIMKEKASEYGFNPEKIGIMGSSAGGHFAAMLATMYGEPQYRPAFQILLYPVITMDESTHAGTKRNLLGESPTPQMADKYSLEKQVTADTPPAFIILAADDKTVPAINSLRYAESLQAAGIPYSLHVYPDGGHGFGFRDTFRFKPEWTADLSHWLRER